MAACCLCCCVRLLDLDRKLLSAFSAASRGDASGRSWGAGYFDDDSRQWSAGHRGNGCGRLGFVRLDELDEESGLGCRGTPGSRGYGRFGPGSFRRRQPGDVSVGYGEGSPRSSVAANTPSARALAESTSLQLAQTRREADELRSAVAEIRAAHGGVRKAVAEAREEASALAISQGSRDTPRCVPR